MAWREDAARTAKIFGVTLAWAFLLSSLVLIVSGAPAQVTFKAATPSSTGITWKHNNAHSAQRYLPETVGAGVAIFDYDRDGWMDLFFVNSGTAPFYKPQIPHRHALYRNNREGTFSDVTGKAGLEADLFGMGAAVGDYDADGNPDLMITGYGKSVLYRNNGHGTFSDVTSRSGITAPGWSTSAVWFDYNNDGRLDLYVLQFVNYESLRICGAETAYGGAKSAKTARAETYYCIPRVLPPTSSHLYRNDGGGRFTDVSRETGIANTQGKGLGVVAADVNNDGFLDLFQANDTVQNFLWMNRSGKRFDEIALEAGVGYGETGMARSGMGVDAAHVDGDGWQDLFVANVDQEMFSLYRNDRKEIFSDIALSAGIAQPTRLLSGWGLKFFDYDNDGRQDLILANGHPDDRVEQRIRGVTHREPLLLFRNSGTGKMQNESSRAGEAFHRTYNARGLAVGDLDNDGDLDVVVTSNGDAPLLLYNSGTPGRHWLGLELLGKQANVEGTGAIIKWSVNGVVHSRARNAGGSYLSSHDRREIIGLGDAARVDWVEIHWPRPSQHVDRIVAPALDRYIRVVEGSNPIEKIPAEGMPNRKVIQ